MLLFLDPLRARRVLLNDRRAEGGLALHYGQVVFAPSCASLGPGPCEVQLGKVAHVGHLPLPVQGPIRQGLHHLTPGCFVVHERQVHRIAPLLPIVLALGGC